MRIAHLAHRIVIALLALVAATLAIACRSDQATDHEPARTRSFYAEVAVEVDSSPGDPLARLGSGGQRSVVRWWYTPDPARWRWEVETAGNVIDDVVFCRGDCAS